MKGSLQHTLMITVVALIAGSCTTPTSDDEMAREAANITVEARTRTRVFVTLLVNIENTGAESLFYTPCSDVLYRAVGSRWERVWHSICPLGGEQPVTEILPGDRLEFELRDISPRSDAHADTWIEPVDGTYRFGLWSLRGLQGDLPRSARLSHPFEIRDE